MSVEDQERDDIDYHGSNHLVLMFVAKLTNMCCSPHATMRCILRAHVDHHIMPRLTEYEQRREVEHVVVHPRYNSGTNKLSVLMKILCHLSPPTNQNHQHHQFNRNDIALLKVKSDFNCIERRLYPACLPTRYRNCTDIKTEAKQAN